LYLLLAVMGLTKTDAVTYAPHGIRINAICPGYVGTPLLLEATVSYWTNLLRG